MTTASCLTHLPRGNAVGAFHALVQRKEGGRTLKAVAWLQQAGFNRLQTLTGGILARIRDVEHGKSRGNRQARETSR